MLLFAPETSGDFAEQLVLLFPAGLNCPRVDSLKMVAVVYGSVEKNNVSALFGSRELVLQGGMSIDCWNKVER